MEEPRNSPASSPPASTTAPNPAGGEQPDTRPYLWPRALTLIVVMALLVGSASIGLKPLPDKGVRVWLLNHTPDQVQVIDPQVWAQVAKFGVADGLRKIAFSADGRRAYIASVVDVTNRISIVDTRTFVKVDDIVTTGVPQGVAVMPANPRRRELVVPDPQNPGRELTLSVPPYPADRYLAYIPGSRTKFEAVGFDVLDLYKRNPTDPDRFRVACRIRDNRIDLLDDIQASPDGRYIYAVAAKSSKIYVYDFWKCLLRLPQEPAVVDIGQAIMGLYIPKNGPYYYAAAIKSKMIYVIDRKTNKIVRYLRHPDDFFGRFRNLVTDESGTIIYATVLERKELLEIDANTGEVLNSVLLPERCDLIEISPYYDELYVVSVDSGNFYRVKIDGFKISKPLTTRGEFRDIAVQPIPPARMLTASQLRQVRERE